MLPKRAASRWRFLMRCSETLNECRNSALAECAQLRRCGGVCERMSVLQMEYLHKCQVLHLDLKPANGGCRLPYTQTHVALQLGHEDVDTHCHKSSHVAVLCTADHHTALCDFGVSKLKRHNYRCTRLPSPAPVPYPMCRRTPPEGLPCLYRKKRDSAAAVGPIGSSGFIAPGECLV